MAEEKQTEFYDRMWKSRPDELSLGDLIRYVETGTSMAAVAPAVKTRLLELLRTVK